MNSELNIKWYDRPWAAFIFFTRLPLWRLHQPPQEAYQSVVEWWPLVGWLTGGAMAATLYFGSMFMPYPLAILLAIVVRMMLTGALHEDGLADFFDGFGGGVNRERILAIMKDSHIGSYGVLALVLYLALLFTSLLSIGNPLYAALIIFAADAYARMLAAQFVGMLPYARTEEEAKARVVYRKPTLWAGIGLALQGLLPLAALLWWLGDKVVWTAVVFVPALVMYFLYVFVRRRIGGYTGDCCGAVVLMVELACYLTMVCCLS